MKTGKRYEANETAGGQRILNLKLKQTNHKKELNIRSMLSLLDYVTPALLILLILI